MVSESRDLVVSLYRLEESVAGEIAEAIKLADLIMINDRFGYYRNAPILGRGAFGEVLRGFDVVMRLDIAIKVIKISEREKENSLLKKEIEMMEKIKGLNIVEGFGSFSNDTHVFLFMELCDESLKDKLNKVKIFSETESLEVLDQVSAAFSTLADSIIHRDIKPANILLSKNKVKIADFGLAKFIADGKVKAKHTCVGTQWYMSPQVILNKDYSAKCDVFSTGIIFYEMLHGKLPWGDSGTLGIIKNPTMELEISSSFRESTKFLLRGMLAYEEDLRLDWIDIINYKSKVLIKDPIQLPKKKRSKRRINFGGPGGGPPNGFLNSDPDQRITYISVRSGDNLDYLDFKAKNDRHDFGNSKGGSYKGDFEVPEKIKSVTVYTFLYAGVHTCVNGFKLEAVPGTGKDTIFGVATGPGQKYELGAAWLVGVEGRSGDMIDNISLDFIIDD